VLSDLITLLTWERLLQVGAIGLAALLYLWVVGLVCRGQSQRGG
jgi:hypothetical protein